MIGPGKYDEETTEVRSKTGGEVILLVFNGKKGSGLSAQVSLTKTLALPTILRNMADEIEDGLKRGKL